jgi:hypothetical protein
MLVVGVAMQAVVYGIAPIYRQSITMLSFALCVLAPRSARLFGALGVLGPGHRNGASKEEFSGAGGIIRAPDTDEGETIMAERNPTLRKQLYGEAGQESKLRVSDALAAVYRVSQGALSVKMVAIAQSVWDLERTTTPSFDRISITSDGIVMGRETGDIGYNAILGSQSDLERNLRGLRKAMGLSPEDDAWARGMEGVRIETFKRVELKGLSL